MAEKDDALFSHYIIDGVRMDMSPAELLEECTEMEDYDFPDGEEFEDIIDESTEPPLSAFEYDSAKEQEYLEKTTAASNEERPFRMLYPEHFSRLQVAKALMSRLWSKGHFKLGNLKLWAQWEWDTAPIGNMSAFYRSAESASGYIYGLGVKLEDYLFIENSPESNVKFFSWLDERYERPFPDIQDDGNDTPDEAPSLFKSSPFESRHPWISEERACPAVMKPEDKSWIIYIPFDTCSFKIGGSLLTQVEGIDGGKAPEINDPDYFIDCYEVVRELVEDGLVMAGANVADGGLLTAAARMCTECGMELDLNGIMASYQETSRAKVLFGEVPGIIMQISDEDYDYVDSQLLLQDIAYYPIGHPSLHHTGIKVSEDRKNGVSDILAALIRHTSEGED